MTKQSNKTSKETLARRNAFFSATPEQLEQVLKNTQSLTVQTRKNFSEEEKQHVTPKQTKKNAPAKVSPVVNLKNLNDPQARQFVNTCKINYQGRFVEYCRDRKSVV